MSLEVEHLLGKFVDVDARSNQPRVERSSTVVSGNSSVCLAVEWAETPVSVTLNRNISPSVSDEVVDFCAVAVEVFVDFANGNNSVEYEFSESTLVVGQTVHAVERADSAFESYFLTEVVGAVGEVSAVAEFRALREFDSDALVEVFFCGAIGDNERVRQSERSRPFDVASARNRRNARSDSANDITFHPTVFTLVCSSACHCERTSLGAFKRFAEDTVFVRAERELPRTVEVTEDTHDSAFAFGKSLAVEVSITAGAHRQRSRTVGDCLRSGFLIFSKSSLSAVFERNAVEANELALHFDDAFFSSGERADRSANSVHLSGLGKAVKLRVSLEVFERHKSGLPTVSIAEVGPTELLQAGIFAEIHVGNVDNHFLTHAVVGVKAVLVDRERNGRSFVLDDEVFVDVAGSVRADNATLDDDVFAFVGKTDSVDAVSFVEPVFSLQVVD